MLDSADVKVNMTQNYLQDTSSETDKKVVTEPKLNNH